MLRFLRNKLAKFSDDCGVAAVEFALLGMPFIGLIAAIVETGVEQIYISHLDRAVQSFAADLRSGATVLKSVNTRTALQTALSNKLCPQISALPGFMCNKLQVQLFNSAACKTGATNSCWADQYADFNHAIRKPPTYFTSKTTFVLGAAGDSQYLTVYYPFPTMSSIWRNSATTATVNGVRVHGILSTAMWINDPSIGVF